MTLINISDLIPVTHGEAVLKVDTQTVRGKDANGKRVVLGYRGLVRVEFPKRPEANYDVPVEGDALRLTDADATADAIALRKDIIDQNKVS